MTIPIPALEALKRHLEQKAPASRESIHDVMKRVVSAQPEIYMAGHEGYYRHDDIARLIVELTDPQSFSFVAFDVWCDRLGVAAQFDYHTIPHCTLAGWYTDGATVEEAVPMALDYLADHAA